MTGSRRELIEVQGGGLGLGAGGFGGGTQQVLRDQRLGLRSGARSPKGCRSSTRSPSTAP
jgi:hypothetical protein